MFDFFFFCGGGGGKVNCQLNVLYFLADVGHQQAVTKLKKVSCLILFVSHVGFTEEEIHR